MPSRRQLLRSFGLGAASLPWLEITAARGAAPPRRLLILTKCGGNVADVFWPQAPAGRLDGVTLPRISAPLEPWKAKLNLLGGLGLRSGQMVDQHLNYGAILTGTAPMKGVKDNPATSASLDHHIGEAVGRRHKLVANSLVLGVGQDLAVQTNGRGHISWRGPAAPNHYEHDPYKVFDRLFAANAAPGAEADRAHRAFVERRSLLDFTARRLGALKSRLGSEDRQRVDAHLEAVRALERQVQELSDRKCAAPPVATVAGARLPAAPGRESRPHIPALLKMQLDLAVAALRCDLTRVALVNIGDSYSTELDFRWLNLPITHRSHHGIKHFNEAKDYDPAKGREAEIIVEEWYIQQLAYLLGQLEGSREGTGTMLDATAVLWADSQANGRVHSTNGVPWILAGSCGGFFRTGQLLRFGGWAKAADDRYWTASTVGHVNVLRSLCQALEAPAEFGDPQYGADLPGLLA